MIIVGATDSLGGWRRSESGGNSGFLKIDAPFEYIASIDGRGNTLFLRYDGECLEQCLDYGSPMPSGTPQPSYTGRAKVSPFKRPMMTEELDDFVEDFGKQMNTFYFFDTRSGLLRGLETLKERAEKQIAEHSKNQSFLRYFDTQPYEARVLAMMLSGIGGDRFLKMYQMHSQIYMAEGQNLLQLDAYVPRQTLDSFKALYEEARMMFSGIYNDERVAYRSVVRAMVSPSEEMAEKMDELSEAIAEVKPLSPEMLAILKRASERGHETPKTADNILLQELLPEIKFPEFAPEMGKPITRAAYKK